MSLFPSIFVPLPLYLCMKSTSYFFPFRMMFFYLVTTGWISDISLCENSINQSTRIALQLHRSLTFPQDGLYRFSNDARDAVVEAPEVPEVEAYRRHKGTAMFIHERVQHLSSPSKSQRHSKSQRYRQRKRKSNKKRKLNKQDCSYCTVLL